MHLLLLLFRSYRPAEVSRFSLREWGVRKFLEAFLLRTDTSNAPP